MPKPRPAPRPENNGWSLLARAAIGSGSNTKSVKLHLIFFQPLLHEIENGFRLVALGQHTQFKRSIHVATGTTAILHSSGLPAVPLYG